MAENDVFVGQQVLSATSVELQTSVHPPQTYELQEKCVAKEAATAVGMEVSPSAPPSTTEMFIQFTHNHELNEHEIQSVEHLQQMDEKTSLRVLPGICDRILELGIDVLVPLERAEWLTDPVMNARLSLLQYYLRFQQSDVSTLILPTFFWTLFLRDSDKKNARAKQEHLQLVKEHLKDFQMDGPTIKQVCIPMNAGGKSSRGVHWKALLLQIDASPCGTRAAGSIWDLDSLSMLAGRPLQRQAVTDLYTFLRPNGSARVLCSASKMSKKFRYDSILPTVKFLPSRPLQTNSYDCGMFTVAGIESMALRGVLDFVQEEMGSLRDQLLLQFTCRSFQQVRSVRS